MSPVDILFNYFPGLSDNQRKQFGMLGALYTDWNSQINVISRKDMEHFYERHVLHSLAIAKVISFAPGTRILDIGTGGGFPGIPLAIMFPESEFFLVDSIGKKIKVVESVANEIGLNNVSAWHGRAENAGGKYHFVVNRAVAQMEKLVNWSRGKWSADQFNPLKNGILSLKGGDLDFELGHLRSQSTEFPISGFFSEPFFETKKVVHIVQS